MKKFASILTAAMLLASMLICSVPAGAATSTAIDAEQKGSVTLTKYETTKVSYPATPVKGAGFSFYQILSYTTDGYKLTDLAKDAITTYNNDQTEASSMTSIRLSTALL